MYEGEGRRKPVSQAKPPPAAVKATYTRNIRRWLKSINRVMRPNVSLLPLYAILHADIQLYMAPAA